ncbi:MAG: DUF5518 domain-containing protein [Methanobacteriaceae archaeon]|jgi:hypothetical protein|nr:DUF5518 domain-containing protein [Candidatus Methanorudis spinitermitis]
MILKWGPIIIGIVLILLVKMLMAPYDIIGLIAVGFVIGYMVNDGAISGLVNSAIAGTIEAIIGTLIYAFINSYTSFQSFIMHELTNLSLLTALTALLYQLAFFCIIMGISGAIGGSLNKNKGN